MHCWKAASVMTRFSVGAPGEKSKTGDEGARRVCHGSHRDVCRRGGMGKLVCPWFLHGVASGNRARIGCCRSDDSPACLHAGLSGSMGAGNLLGGEGVEDV